MKFLVALTAVVALATVNCQLLPNYGKGPLYDDIQYFTNMIPMEKVLNVVMQYTVKDAEFKQLLKYIRSSEFKEMMAEIEAIPEFHNFATYMQNNGVYMYDMLNDLNKAVGLPSFQPLLITKQITGGLRGLFLDVKALINYDDIIHGYAYKMRTSQAFRDFVAELKSSDHQNFINQLYQKQRYLSFRSMLVSKGLDITLVEDVIFTVLGVEFPVLNKMALYENRLSKDIHDFIDLIDMDKIVNIVSSYLQDDQVQEAIAYMKSEEFHVLVRKVEALKAYQDLVEYLHNAGLDIYGLLQNIHRLFGMEDYVPPNGKFYANLGGVKAMVDAVRAALPMDQFKALFQEKMQTSPDFKAFVEQLQSSEFQVIVDTIYKEPIVLEMRRKAKDVGLDLDRGRHFFEEIGIKLPRPSSFFFLTPFDNRLSRDIHDFIDLIDMDKIVNIVSSYMQDDQVQEAIAYMKSEEFHVLVRKVEALKAYQNLVKYLHNAGLDIYGLLQNIHRLFGMEDYVPPNGKFYANLGGVKAMVDAVRAALPMDQFKALFQEKMQTSPDFKAFVEQLQSSEFQVIVDTIYKEPIVLEMRRKAKDVGLDLDRGRHFFEEIGIKLPRPPVFFFLTPFENRLSKDIHDFIDLVDMDKIVNIVSSYMQDDQVQEAIAYMKSEEFHVLVRKVEALKAYQNLVEYLHNAGLDIYGLLQKVHRLFGMEDYVPPKGKFYANLGGVKALVDAVRAALPMDQFKALFQQKMQTSPDFKTFVDQLQSSEFQVIVDTIYKEPIFLEMRQKAKDVGLDLDRGRHFFEEIGIKLPRPSAFFFLTPFENRLSRDIHDFIDLIDMDKIVNIVSSYMQDDQVQEAIAYMKSEEFHVLVRKVEALKAYQDLVKYLHNAGLDIYGLLQKVHRLFGMEDYVPPSGRYVYFYANLGGVKALVDAVRAALPMDQFKALFQQKMQTSPDFKTFVDQLQSSEFQVIVDTIYKEPIFLEMRQKAKDVGLDLDRGRHFFEEIGIKLPRPSGFVY